MSKEFLPRSDVINPVVGNSAEDAAKISPDSVLSTIINDIIADHMGADMFFRPAHTSSFKNQLQLMLMTGFPEPLGFQIAMKQIIAADADSHTFGVMNDIILNHPSPAPARSDQPLLIRARRRPACSRMSHLES